MPTLRVTTKLPGLFYLRAHNARRAGNQAELRRWIEWAAKRVGGWQRLEFMPTMTPLLKALYSMEHTTELFRSPDD